ncbi:UDP-glucose 4-epimerase [Synechococcus sp. SYN20]|uniref:UDP-glucose 4-epimerase GalE n=1 Tax=Synechococcus sp. SYN20 TaxID=1050714 RepID=UPI001647C6A8|nr:UDP-glucose 4-epimerase GalE [Synechococcus sp. SYN20]QNJ24663.1 UDP-glucose 4-epimerase [Synechococcus sp. SYN20]
MAQLLITGGAGFIGSHTCLVLLEAGHQLLVLDDFSNSSAAALERVAELAGTRLLRAQSTLVSAPEVFTLVEGDIRDAPCLDALFASAKAFGQPIDAVIHFAGLKAVGESVQQPLRYWDVNVAGTQRLLSAMDKHHCRTVVFSSSATLYGYPDQVPIPETAPIQPINPYGASKQAAEALLADVAGCSGNPEPIQASEGGWRIARLRYFNPVGAHPSGRIGEDPNGIPNNLFPFITQVAVGRRPELTVFGDDWPTPDGTGVRDYIHVMDLAEGHREALHSLLSSDPQLLTLNLGSGQGASVLDVVKAMEAASHQVIPYRIAPRRPGDAAITVAKPNLAAQQLDWRTQRSLTDICRDGWAWQKANPNGYGEACL